MFCRLILHSACLSTLPNQLHTLNSSRESYFFPWMKHVNLHFRNGSCQAAEQVELEARRPLVPI